MVGGEVVVALVVVVEPFFQLVVEVRELAVMEESEDETRRRPPV